MRRILLIVILLLPGMALAHASEQGFVLLLPTDVYITAGVASVALTVILLAMMPARLAQGVFHPVSLWRRAPMPLHHVTSTLAAVLLAGLIWLGLSGPRDPLANLLPLVVWTVWWIALVVLQGVIGNHWRWTNPWTGPAALLTRLTGLRALFRYPRRLGFLPGIVIFLAFAVLLLADPAPADPARLALFAGGYWYATMFGILLFGPRWLLRGEALTILMRSYARVSLLGRRGRQFAIGLPGWKIMARPHVPMGLAVFILILLGTGSFDGLNETFWWFSVLGINPLEFPGRSAVITQTILGLLAANAALITAYGVSIWLGLRIARADLDLGPAFRLFAPSILPIALGYHLAHYLTSLMVDSQYALKAATDPLARGDDLLGLGQFYVTTGFFNTQATVRAIWLTQAGAVVIGHVIAILLAHALALHAFGSTRRATLSQAPLALFMVAYTFFGLWLLASPRGL
ncbi:MULTISPECIES: hypothetical protein [unclassified Roseovarius]|uniref:hypothetical protein n=1 Tax=unclassified Roseovarius TaxID=2614913 RepID=UPI00273EF4DB|nr:MULTISPECIES: hypothetical protein [unclassified Roseovarius]